MIPEVLDVDPYCCTGEDGRVECEKGYWRHRALAAEAKVVKLAAAMKRIARLGGNLPDDRLTSRTGPNDARHRGLMYVAARAIAEAALVELAE